MSHLEKAFLRYKNNNSSVVDTSAGGISSHSSATTH
jgi:hypothetical protein